MKQNFKLSISDLTVIALGLMGFSIGIMGLVSPDSQYRLLGLIPSDDRTGNLMKALLMSSSMSAIYVGLKTKGGRGSCLSLGRYDKTGLFGRYTFMINLAPGLQVKDAVKNTFQPKIYNSLIMLNRDLGLPEPMHPLITLSNLEECTGDLSAVAEGVLLNFYQLSFKHSINGSIRYGQHHYDYDNGGLSFMAPNQLLATGGSDEECEGTTLMIHPDFLKGYPLARTIKQYGFFSYSAHEALHLSEKEKEVILSIYTNIREELRQRIDHFSQNIMISQIESLLNYSDRFYNRQFITRKPVYTDLLHHLDQLLEAWFNSDEAMEKGLPSVHLLADQLALSKGYLSDLLRNLTGMNAQQHIHHKVIEKAKECLTAGELTIAQVAYKLGFEHPQSFNKIFRKKTNLSPNEYRLSLKQLHHSSKPLRQRKY